MNRSKYKNNIMIIALLIFFSLWHVNQSSVRLSTVALMQDNDGYPERDIEFTLSDSDIWCIA